MELWDGDLENETEFTWGAKNLEALSPPPCQLSGEDQKAFLNNKRIIKGS